MTSETTLLKQIAHGDTAALDTLMIKYEDAALRTAYLTTRDRLLAEDIVQTAFVKVCCQPHIFMRAQNFRAYFLRSVRNMALDALRANNTLADAIDRYEYVTDTLESREPSPSTVFEASERSEQLRGALSQLTSEQRTVIVGYYYMDLSLAQVAVRAGVPEGTVKSRLYGARRRLRGLLQHIA